MHQYGQTNLQLFNQLRRDGYSNTELRCIFNAYKLVTSLHTGCFKPSGKTFIAHLIGTASILNSLHVPANIVVAGLLHAVYFNGGISKTKREHLTRIFGSEVEEYIARYTALQWSEQTIPAIHARIDTLDKIDRDVLLIRLANELEEYLDLGILYSGSVKQLKYAERNHHLVVDMAKKLGFPTLASELANLITEASATEIPIELRDQNGKNSWFFIAPMRKKRFSLELYHAAVQKLLHLRSAWVMKT